jgi:hypothetical protein
VPGLSLTGTDGLADGIVGAMMGGLARAALQRGPAGFSENFVGGQELDELENVLALICLLVLSSHRAIALSPVASKIDFLNLPALSSGVAGCVSPDRFRR